MSLFVHFVLPKGSKKLIWYQKSGFTLKFCLNKVKNMIPKWEKFDFGIKKSRKQRFQQSD